MRGGLFALLLALGATPASAADPALPATPSLPPRPDPFLAPNITYVRVGEADVGRWQYVNVPAGRAPEQVQTWRIDVFRPEIAVPHGRGAYSVSLYIYDCRARMFRMDHSELFDARGKAIERFDGPVGFTRADPRADEDLRQACGMISYDGPALRGLEAVLADARGAAGG
jgi:hypothetical protein